MLNSAQFGTRLDAPLGGFQQRVRGILFMITFVLLYIAVGVFIGWSSRPTGVNESILFTSETIWFIRRVSRGTNFQSPMFSKNTPLALLSRERI